MGHIEKTLVPRETVLCRTGCILPFSGKKILEDRCQLFSEAAGFGDGFELPVYILRITLLTNADSAYDDHVMLKINTINQAVFCELMLPIAGQRSAQWQPVSFRVNGELFLQDFSELIPHASVESFDIRCGVQRVSKFKGKWGACLFWG
jgi:hypothetical protein